MPMLTLLNIFAGTILMTALYAFSRPILDRAGDPSLRHIRPIVMRTQRSRARERRNAVILAVAGTVAIILINTIQFNDKLPLIYIATLPTLVALAVYKYRRRAI